MKTIAIMTAVALSGLTAMSAETTSSTDNMTATPTATCSGSDKGIQCDDTAWLNVETVTIEAANGDPIAQYAIAYITDNGINNTPKDPEKAQALYSQALPGLEKAAKDGDPNACRALARMYAEGKGVEKDSAKAEEYLKQCRECSKKKAEEQKKSDQSESGSSTSSDM